MKKNRRNTDFLKVNKEDAQSILNLLKKKLKNETVIDKTKKVLSEKEFVLFPLVKNKKSIKNLIEFIDSKFNFEIIVKKGYFLAENTSQSLKSILMDKLPKQVFKLIPKSYDIIGDIAIIEFNRFRNLNYKKSLKYKKKFAKTLLTVNKSLKSIYEKKSEIKSKYRLRDLEFIFGEEKSETIHKENNCFFKVNVKKTYFSPRLVYERNRLSNFSIKENEIIIDMFAGIGPFSIQLAKNHNVRIYSFDINPYAYKYLKENISLNKLKGYISPFNTDIKELLNPTNNLGNQLKHLIDRVIMNLPEKSLEYINVACFLMKNSGGILHNYQFVDKPNSINKAITHLKNALEKSRWTIEKIINSKIVKHFSPKSDLVVIDSIIKPLV